MAENTNITINDPVKGIKDNVLFSKITSDGNRITFQNKDKIIIEKENKAKLYLSDKNKDKINSITDIVIKETSINSEKWFGKHINEEDCTSIYKNALDDQGRLHCFYNSDTKFFDSNSRLNVDEIIGEVFGIALLKCISVVYTSTSFFLRWEISQFKLKKEEKNDSVGYIIRDLPEHEHNDFEFENMIKRVTLF
tara:strand:- start:6466 stop:7047 length:582 start_codon:yes stop_codon:yes gene_type:complete